LEWTAELVSRFGVGIGWIDGLVLTVVDVGVAGGRQIERFTVEIAFQQAESLGGVGSDELLEGLEVQSVFVVFVGDEFLKRVVAGGFVDVLAERLVENVGSILVEDGGDRVDPLDEVLGRVKVDALGISVSTHLTMHTFCTWKYKPWYSCASHAHRTALAVFVEPYERTENGSESDLVGGA